MGCVSSPDAAVSLLRSVPLGTRVTVRWALGDDDGSGKLFTDSIGVIVSAAEFLVLETRRGEVRIDWPDVRLAKQVPPPPRRTPRAR